MVLESIGEDDRIYRRDDVIEVEVRRIPRRDLNRVSANIEGPRDDPAASRGVAGRNRWAPVREERRIKPTATDEIGERNFNEPRGIGHEDEPVFVPADPFKGRFQRQSCCRGKRVIIS